MFSAYMKSGGEIEWITFIPDHWQKNLTAWYNETRTLDLRTRPDATGVGV